MGEYTPVLRALLVAVSVGVVGQFIVSPNARSVAARIDGVSGVPGTGYAVANLGSSDLSSVRVHRWFGDGTSDQGIIGIPACSVAPFEIDDRWLMSGILIEADSGSSGAAASLGAVGRTFWPSSLGLVDSVSGPLATEFVIPLALSRMNGQTSQIMLLNTHRTAGANVNMVFRRIGESEPLGTVDLSVQASSHRTLTLDDPVEGLEDVAGGFIGWVQISSDVAIAVGSVVDVRTSTAAVYSVDAIPNDGLANTLYAPEVIREAWGISGIALVNPHEHEIPVGVTFTGQAGACAGQSYTQSAVVPPNTSVLFFQGGTKMPITGTSPLPDGCVASAEISALHGVAAVVNQTGHHDWPPGWASAYRAIREEDAAETILIPIWRQKYIGAWATGVNVLNTGSRDATASIRRWSHTGHELECEWPDSCGPVTVAAGSTHYWSAAWPLDYDQPDTEYGWARIESNQPLVALVRRQGLFFPHDSPPYGYDAAMYAGLPCGRAPVAESALVFPGPSVPCPGPCPKPTFIPTSTSTQEPDPQTPPPLMPTATSSGMPSATAGAIDTSTAPTPATPTSTSTPTAPPSPAVSPTATATPTPRGYARVCEFIVNRVPLVAVHWAIANPEKIYGWDLLAFPSRPPSPVNIRRHRLSIRNVAMPYDAWFNPLVYKAGCP